MAVLRWLNRVVSDAKGVPSTSRVVFLFAVVMGAVWLTLDLVLSVKTLKVSGIGERWVLVFGIWFGGATGGYLGAKKIASSAATPGADAPRTSQTTMEAQP